MVNYLYIIGFSLVASCCFAQVNDIELSPEGIIFSRVTTAERNALNSTVGLCVFNTEQNALECFDGIRWRGNKLKDDDGDTGIVFEEFGVSSPDRIDFQINNHVPMKLEESPSGSTRLYLNDSSDNLLIGTLAGDLISAGSKNIFIGEDAGRDVLKGNFNIAVGEKAGHTIGNGDYNIAIGREAGYNMGNGIDNIAIGHDAGRSIDGSIESIFIGSEAGFINNRSKNMMIGTRAGRVNSGSLNTFLGYEAGKGDSSLVSDGNENVAIGHLSASTMTSGSLNTSIGALASANLTSGDGNVAIGYAAGRSVGKGTGNIMVGASAGEFLSGSENIVIGNLSGSRLSGDHNILLGSDTGGFSNGSHQLFIGPSVDDKLITGEFDNETVTIHGDLQIFPKGNNLTNNTHLRMANSNGSFDNILTRIATDNDVVIGDVDNFSSSIFLYAGGENRFSVLTSGVVRFVPMPLNGSGPNQPSTLPICDASRAGQMYYDNSGGDVGFFIGCGSDTVFGGNESWNWQVMHELNPN